MKLMLVSSITAVAICGQSRGHVMCFCFALFVACLLACACPWRWVMGGLPW